VPAEAENDRKEEDNVDGVSAATPYRPEGKSDLSLSVSALHQFETDLDNGGGFRVGRYSAKAGAERKITQSLGLGFNVGYEIHDYSFSGDTKLAGTSPWEEVHILGLSARARYRLSDKWNLSGGPYVKFSRESGAGWSDSLIYGVMVAFSGQIRPDLMLGLGARVSREFEEIKALPFLMFSWEITERLRLSNPLRSGPMGPAGLMLAYRPAGQWEMAAAASYKSLRFRTDRGGGLQDGIGKDRGIPIWVRLSRTFRDSAELHLYAGAMAGGDLTISDEDGDELESDDYETAPFLGVSFSVDF
jgi:hypothetical protein